MQRIDYLSNFQYLEGGCGMDILWNGWSLTYLVWGRRFFILLPYVLQYSCGKFQIMLNYMRRVKQGIGGNVSMRICE